MSNDPRHPGMVDGPADNLSDRAAKLLRYNMASLNRRLVVQGGGDADARVLLETLSPADMLSTPVLRVSYAKGALAGLWLLHDWLDEAHTLCQDIETSEGSLWHAILHRREGNFSNAKYWYDRAGTHALQNAWTADAQAIINPLPADVKLMRLVARGWDAAAFVDLVEQAHDTGGSPRLETLIALQQMEWRVLFDHCVRMASM